MFFNISFGIFLKDFMKKKPFQKYIYIYIYNFSCHKQPTFLVIQLFQILKYIFTLFIHPSILNITNITSHSPDDGLAEPKRYSVDFVSL